MQCIIHLCALRFDDKYCTRRGVRIYIRVSYWITYCGTYDGQTATRKSKFDPTRRSSDDRGGLIVYVHTPRRKHEKHFIYVGRRRTDLILEISDDTVFFSGHTRFVFQSRATHVPTRLLESPAVISKWVIDILYRATCTVLWNKKYLFIYLFFYLLYVIFYVFSVFSNGNRHYHDTTLWNFVVSICVVGQNIEMSSL